VALVVDGLGKCNPPRCEEARELVNHLEFNARERLTNNGYYQADDGKGISLSNDKIATALIRSYGRANELDSAMELFSRILPAPDVVAFNALLDALCRNEKLKLALDMFKKHASFKELNEQEERAVDANASGTMRSDKQQKIVVKPDVVTYTTLISGLLQLKSRAATKRAKFLYNEMKQKWWISPDTILVDT